jgi:hypothetical protein
VMCGRPQIARAICGLATAGSRTAQPGRPDGVAQRKLLIILPLLTLAACAATQASDAVAPTAPGFLLGLWHGLIFPLAWIVSLFAPKVAVYAVPNNGGWYDFGYFLGIVVFGVGAKRSHTVVRDRTIYRDRGPVIDSTATRVD